MSSHKSPKAKTSVLMLLVCILALASTCRNPHVHATETDNASDSSRQKTVYIIYVQALVKQVLQCYIPSYMIVDSNSIWNSNPLIAVGELDIANHLLSIGAQNCDFDTYPSLIHLCCEFPMKYGFHIRGSCEADCKNMYRAEAKKVAEGFADRSLYVIGYESTKCEFVVGIAKATVRTCSCQNNIIRNQYSGLSNGIISVAIDLNISNTLSSVEQGFFRGYFN